jgi:hypothetical protein
MCFHIGHEFVEALMSRATDNSTVDSPPETADSTHPNDRREHLSTCGQLASRMRAFIMAGATIKWLLFMLWICL